MSEKKDFWLLGARPYDPCGPTVPAGLSAEHWWTFPSQLGPGSRLMRAQNAGQSIRTGVAILRTSVSALRLLCFVAWLYRLVVSSYYRDSAGSSILFPTRRHPLPLDVAMGRSQVLGASWGTALGSFLVLCASIVSLILI